MKPFFPIAAALLFAAPLLAGEPSEPLPPDPPAKKTAPSDPSAGASEAPAAPIPAAGGSPAAETPRLGAPPSAGAAPAPAAGKAAPLDDVVVTATRYGRRLEDAPASVVRISSDLLQAVNAFGLDEALRYAPGVYDRRTKGIADVMPNLTLRGFDARRNLVLVDGHPRKDWLVLPPEAVDRIEAVKGPFSALWGDRALGGVVNVLTRVPAGRLISAFASGAEKETWSAGAFVADRRGPADFLVAARARETGGWVTNDTVVSEYTGTIAPAGNAEGWVKTRDSRGSPRFLVGDTGRNWYKDRSLTAQGGVEPGAGFSARAFGYYKDSSYGYEGGESRLYLNGSRFTDGVVRVDDGGTARRLRVTPSSFLSTYGGDPSWGAGFTLKQKVGETVALEARTGGSFEDYWYADPAASVSSTRTREAWMTAASVFDLARLDLLGRHTASAGVDVRDSNTDFEKWTLDDWRNPDSRRKLDQDVAGRVFTHGVYLQDEWKVLPELTAFLGARYDSWVSRDGRSRMWNAGTSAWLADRHPRNHEDAWTFKAALVCKPLPGTSIKASFGTAFRGPDTVDLFRTWASGSTVYAANPELVPERSRAFELSVLQTLGGFGEILKGTTLSASVFDNVMEDYIYRRTLDAAGVAAYNARYGTSFTSVRVYENLARARNYGAEASAEQALPYGAAIFASWTHNQTEVLRHEADPAAEGRRLPYVPRNQASLGVRWKTPLGDGLVLTGSVAGRYVEKVFMSDDNSDYAQHVFGTYEDFAVLDAKATLSFDGRASFSLWCDNALGEEYYQYYRAPGRSFGASVEFKY